MSKISAGSPTVTRQSGRSAVGTSNVTNEASYYGRLMEERSKKEKLQAKTEELTSQCENANRRIAEMEKAHHELTSDYVSMQSKFVEDARVAKEQNTTWLRNHKEALTKEYEDDKKAAVERAANLWQAEKTQWEIGLREKLLAEYEQKLGDHKDEHSAHHQGIESELQDSLKTMKQLFLIKEEQADTMLVLNNQNMRMEWMLDTLVKKALQIVQYKTLLRYMSVRVFINTFKFRVSIKKFHAKLAEAVHLAADVLDDAGTNLHTDRQNQIMLQHEARAWEAAYQADYLGKDWDRLPLRDRFFHMVDAVNLLVVCIEQSHQREMNWSDIAAGFLERNNELHEVITQVTNRTVDEKNIIIDQKREILSLQQQLADAKAAICACGLTGVCTCACLQDCACVERAGGMRDSDVRQLEAADPVDFAIRTTKTVKVLRDRLSTSRRVVLQVQQERDQLMMKLQLMSENMHEQQKAREDARASQSKRARQVRRAPHHGPLTQAPHMSTGKPRERRVDRGSEVVSDPSPAQTTATITTNVPAATNTPTTTTTTTTAKRRTPSINRPASGRSSRGRISVLPSTDDEDEEGAQRAAEIWRDDDEEDALFRPLFSTFGARAEGSERNKGRRWGAPQNSQKSGRYLAPGHANYRRTGIQEHKGDISKTPRGTSTFSFRDHLERKGDSRSPAPPVPASARHARKITPRRQLHAQMQKKLTSVSPYSGPAFTVT